MPMPLSGQQRHLVTAMHHIRKGKSEKMMQAAMKKTFGYLTEIDIAEIIVNARIAIGMLDGIDNAAKGERVDNYVATSGDEPFRVASVVAKWTDRKGREQHRTVRVKIPKGSTKEEMDRLIKEEIGMMLAGNGQYKRGKRVYD